MTPERLKILFLSHSALGGAFVVGSHHLARGMAALGHDVLHVSPPVTPAHLLKWRHPDEAARLRRWWRGGEDIGGVRDAIPGAWLTWGISRRLTGRPAATFGWAFRGSLKRILASRQFFKPDVVFIDEPRLVRALDLAQAGSIVYRPTDVYAAIRGDGSILDAERELITRASTFIATSQPVAEHLRSLGAPMVTVIENGVDLTHFENGPDIDVESQLPPRPRAVYAGALDDRFGTAALRAAAQRNTGISFVLIGPAPGTLKQEFADCANVHLLGAIAYADLPSYLRRCQLGLLPLAPHPANEGRSPMKLFEYAASGLPVVSSTTAELRHRGLGFVTLADGPDDFAASVTRVIDQATASAPDPKAEARKNGWAEKCLLALSLART